MFSCAVYGCTNDSLTSDPSIHYHPFPKNMVTEQWVQACGWQSDLIDLDAAHICSIHFDESAYTTEIKMVNFAPCYSKTLNYDAVPTLYLPQTQIIIKDSPLDPDNIKSVVVYTVNSLTSHDGITTVCLPDAALTKQLFQLQPSTSRVKVETQIDPMKSEAIEETEKYSHIRSYPELYVLQANNKSLKRKNEELENEISNLEKMLNASENEHTKLEKQYRMMEAQITNKNMSQQEQKKLLSKVFSESQIKILFGKKKLYWSNDDIAVGYTIRHLSNKRCYAYLTKTLNIPLPAVSSIKRWVTTKKVKKLQNNKKQSEEVTV